MRLLTEMTDTGIKKEVLEEIRNLAARSGIERVILFGSRSRGDFGRASDIDLAVQGGKIAEFTLDVKDTTSTLLEFDIVDLSILPEGSFLDAIRREGILIYEKI